MWSTLKNIKYFHIWSVKLPIHDKYEQKRDQNLFVVDDPLYWWQDGMIADKMGWLTQCFSCGLLKKQEAVYHIYMYLEYSSSFWNQTSYWLLSHSWWDEEVTQELPMRKSIYFCNSGFYLLVKKHWGGGSSTYIRAL